MSHSTRLLIAALMISQPIAAQVLSEQSSGVTAMLQAVSAVGDQVVWVSGHSGVVLRSTDGGESWVLRPVPGADSLQFRDIEALDAERAWALTAGPGEASTIHFTADGGVSWTRQFLNKDPAAFYDCFAFFDDRTGVAFSDASEGRTNILRTIDGGTNWELLPEHAVPAPLEGEGAFAASGGCVTAVDSRHGFMALGGPGARFLRTMDAGATWSVHQTPFTKGPSAGMTAAAFRDAHNGIGVAGNIGAYQADTSSAAVAVTADGGKSWTLGSRPPLPGTPFGVVVLPEVDDMTAIIAAPSGLFVTRDNGNSWTTMTEGNFWSVGASNRSAWAVGARGKLVRIDF